MQRHLDSRRIENWIFKIICCPPISAIASDRLERFPLEIHLKNGDHGPVL